MMLPLLATLALGAGTAGCQQGAEPGVNPGPSRIVRGNGAEPGSLDPALAEDVHAFNILIDLHEGLVTEDASGNRIPGAAESWSISDDGRVYTFRLRDGLRWSNGDALTAADFERALRRVVSPDTASAYAFLLQDIENFDAVVSGRSSPASFGVAAVSDRNLELRLSAPSQDFLAVLSQPVASPAHVSGDLSISSGPYRLVDRHAGTVRLQKNPYYREADQVQVVDIEYVAIVDPVSEFNAYRAGDIDITNTIPGELFDDIRERFPEETYVAPLLALYYLAFDLSEAPFDDRSLRRALSMAIDRRQLTELIGRGEQPACGIVPPGVEGHRNFEYDWCAGDPQDNRLAALAAYTAAGFSAEKPLSVHYIYDAGDPVHERVALAISAMWRDTLGVQTTLEKREWMYFLDTRSERKDWDVMRFAWFGDYNGAHTFLDIFHSASEQNLPGFDDEMYDELLTNPDRSTHDAEQHLLLEYPVAPLYFFVGKHLVKPHVRGFENNVMDRHPSRYLSIDDAVRER